MSLHSACTMGLCEMANPSGKPSRMILAQSQAPISNSASHSPSFWLLDFCTKHMNTVTWDNITSHSPSFWLMDFCTQHINTVTEVSIVSHSSSFCTHHTRQALLHSLRFWLLDFCTQHMNNVSKASTVSHSPSFWLMDFCTKHVNTVTQASIASHSSRFCTQHTNTITEASTVSHSSSFCTHTRRALLPTVSASGKGNTIGKGKYTMTQASPMPSLAVPIAPYLDIFTSVNGHSHKLPSKQARSK